MEFERLKYRVWMVSLLSFLIAAFTGFLYRYGMFWPLPEGIGMSNIRHAHSHLMFFNWVTPPAMVWMAGVVIKKDDTSAVKSLGWCLYTMMFLGFLSYPFFLIFGYHSVPLGFGSLPLAAILSGLVMITWYWFGWLWYRLRTESDDTLALTLFDGALIALMISSLGAWGVSVFQFTDIDSPLISSAMTHFFLAAFTEGWVLLGVMALIWQRFGEPGHSAKIHSGWLWLPILFGSMLIFPFSLNQTVITPAMHLAAGAGLLLIAVSLVLHLWLLLGRRNFRGRIWKFVALLIGLKVAVQIIAVLPLGIWPGEHGLRIFYLHLLLLGIVSITFLELFYQRKNRIACGAFTVSVAIVLISLAMISGYWPSGLMIPDVFYWVTIAAALPLFPVVWILWREISQKNRCM
jgi:hypothetical protein